MSMEIDFRPLEGAAPDPLDRATFSEIRISVNGQALTSLEDRRARFTRDFVRASAYSLALWLAGNWWRLRWEPDLPGSAGDLDWQMSHSLPSASGGAVWPPITFSSDGRSIQIISDPDPTAPDYESVRYLSSFQGRVNAKDFERAVSQFIDSITRRLESQSLGNSPLSRLWSEIQGERGSPDSALYRRRKLEALAGFDPDDIPSDLIQALERGAEAFGVQAVEEIAAECRGKATTTIRWIEGSLKRGPAQPTKRRVTTPGLKAERPSVVRHEAPWEVARELARAARVEWKLGDGPLSNKQLGKLLNSPTLLDSPGTRAPIPFSLALRSTPTRTFDVYLMGRHPSSRRFALCRLIGDSILMPQNEKVCPATDAGTWRQKFQRAFSQEFLAPIETLRRRLKTTRISDDGIQAIAEEFGVSPLFVTTTLVNHGVLDRGVLQTDSLPLGPIPRSSH